MQAAMIDCEVELETGDLISLTQTGIGWPVRHSPAPHRDWNLPCLGNRVSSRCGVTRSAPLGSLQVKSQAFDVTWEQCVYISRSNTLTPSLESMSAHTHSMIYVWVG